MFDCPHPGLTEEQCTPGCTDARAVCGTTGINVIVGHSCCSENLNFAEDGQIIQEVFGKDASLLTVKKWKGWLRLNFSLLLRACNSLSRGLGIHLVHMPN